MRFQDSFFHFEKDRDNNVAEAIARRLATISTKNRIRIVPFGTRRSWSTRCCVAPTGVQKQFHNGVGGRGRGRHGSSRGAGQDWGSVFSVGTLQACGANVERSKSGLLVKWILFQTT